MIHLFSFPPTLRQLAVEEEDVLKEAFFAPADEEGATLQALFEALSTAAELCPEPTQEGEEMQMQGAGAGDLVFDNGRYHTSDRSRLSPLDDLALPGQIYRFLICMICMICMI